MRASLLAAVALAGAALLGQGEGAAGKVTFLAGDATRAPAGGAPEKLSVGSAVRQGDVLETRKRTRLEVRLADGSALRLGPLSRAELSEASFGEKVGDRRVSAKLLVGRIWANVAKAVGGEARFRVETENAVAGVRGTTFRVDAASDRSVVVKVYSGTVAVARGAVPRPEHAGEKDAPQGRKPIPGPEEVSREQWERIVTNMMQVRVSAQGVAGAPEGFAFAAAGKDEWEAWNRTRDAAR